MRIKPFIISLATAAAFSSVSAQAYAFDLDTQKQDVDQNISVCTLSNDSQTIDSSTLQIDTSSSDASQESQNTEKTTDEAEQSTNPSDEANEKDAQSSGSGQSADDVEYQNADDKTASPNARTDDTKTKKLYIASTIFAAMCGVIAFIAYKLIKILRVMRR